MNLKPLKTMILGIQVMLLGGFMTLDPTTNLGGIEFILMLIGLLIGIFGLFLKD